MHIADAVSMLTLHHGAPVVLHDHANHLTASVLPGAGMVVTSLRHRGAELLGQRRGVDAYLRDGKTMGIPLLAPWANRLSVDAFVVPGTTSAVNVSDAAPGVRRDANGYAMHGLLAADSGWDWATDRSRESCGAEPQELRAHLNFAGRPELLATFPFAHRIDVTVTLRGAALTIQTDVTATGSTAVPVAHGLHPYLTLPGVAREHWQVTFPERTHLAVDAHGLPTGATTRQAQWSGVLADRTFDDAYDQVAPGASWVLAGGGRRLTTTFDVG
jgi:aldose 1-epimerase